MSGSPSYNTYESEVESSGWLVMSETSVDDELSDELTLLNGDEDCDEDTLSFDALIKLSMRLKKQYNLREATVQLERCDKIWDTMQLLKQIQMDDESEATETADEDDADDEEDSKPWSSTAESRLPEGGIPSVPYIKYQPVQGNGNNALPNFYLAVKSQKKLYNCVTCGKQYSEKRSLVLHSKREHGIVTPKAVKKSRTSTDNKTPSQDPLDNKIRSGSSSRDCDNSKSRLSGASKNGTEQNGTKTEPEESAATGEIHEKNFSCPICRAIYRFQRGMTKHMMFAHNMTLAEARAKYRETIRTASMSPVKNEFPPINYQDVKKEKSGVKKEASTDGDSGKSPYLEPSGHLHHVFTCKTCGQRFQKKKKFRLHAQAKHKITISAERSAPKRPNERIREYEHYTCEFLYYGTGENAARGGTSGSGGSKLGGGSGSSKSSSSGGGKSGSKTVRKVEDKSYTRSLVKDESLLPKTRSGRPLGVCPRADRPRRACAINTSYTECTKEEEEVLQREFIFANVTSESPKASSSQTTLCFLCKKAYVDVERHLKDYHRINCLDTILPLTAKAAESEKDNESVASGETFDSLPQRAEKDEPEEKEEGDEANEDEEAKKLPYSVRIKMWNRRLKKAKTNPNIRVLTTYNVGRAKGRNTFVCVVCSHTFKRLSHIQMHQDKYEINGVLQDHPRPISMRKRPASEVPEDPVADPLALTDSADTARDASDEEEDAETAGRKRRISSSDERLSTSSEPRTKRRKIEEPDEFAGLGSESTSDSIQYNSERESVLVMAGSDHRFNGEDKLANPRDTRDSSDRDSGIGISITIKKRNNSYEVVEKDSGDDDKSKDFEHSKDDNTSSDSSSDATPVNFVNDDQEARRREILHSLNCSAEENVVDSVTPEYIDDNAFGGKKEEEKVEEEEARESCPNNDNEANYRWNGEENYGEEARASLSGNVPSLKIMCRTVLSRDDFTILPDNQQNSHQCPVCYRFYPTERDVTVHMLEHKVSRAEFRATRVHAIPSSALRRYGRRPV